MSKTAAKKRKRRKTADKFLLRLLRFFAGKPELTAEIKGRLVGLKSRFSATLGYMGQIIANPNV